MSSKPQKSMAKFLCKEGEFIGAISEHDLARQLAGRYGGRDDLWRKEVSTAIHKKVLVPTMQDGKSGYRISSTSKSTSTSSAKRVVPSSQLVTA